MPPAGGGTKKALIIGCNYPGTQSQLRGCINDAQCMEFMLKTKFGFRVRAEVFCMRATAILHVHHSRKTFACFVTTSVIHILCRQGSTF